FDIPREETGGLRGLASRARAALETRCPVCLENWDSVAYTMPCCHQFCFPCIHRWTSTRPQCPLCKQGVQSIIHTVRADNDYKELVLRPAAVASTARRSPTGSWAAQPWGPDEPRRGRPATARPQHHQRRGHPAGRIRTVVELVRLGPGSSWDTYWPQWTLAMSIQFHHVNKVERKTAKKKKMCWYC
uniref:E3 ubiquitin-protein ligase Topors n=1 Tax=Gallus gallus TaxID=9031 RepID=A0A8V0XIN7_CHICK